MLFANLFDLFVKVFNKLRFIKREKINDVIIFTFIIIKARYNVKHLTLNLKKKKTKFFLNYIMIILFLNYRIKNYYNKESNYSRCSLKSKL